MTNFKNLKDDFKKRFCTKLCLWKNHFFKDKRYNINICKEIEIVNKFWRSLKNI